jgi:hypothetical protein
MKSNINDAPPDSLMDSIVNLKVKIAEGERIRVHSWLIAFWG